MVSCITLSLVQISSPFLIEVRVLPSDFKLCNSIYFNLLLSFVCSFPQACIVAKAYNHSVDWGEALYQHCIVQGDVAYLPDFVYNKPLTTSLVEDVARRLVLYITYFLLQVTKYGDGWMDHSSRTVYFFITFFLEWSVYSA